jgi:hypothetical protein
MLLEPSALGVWFILGSGGAPTWKAKPPVVCLNLSMIGDTSVSLAWSVWKAHLYLGDVSLRVWGGWGC